MQSTSGIFESWPWLGVLLPFFATLVSARADENAVAAAGLTASRLRCEYLTNPLGIDEKRPRLSWIVQSSQRGQRQTAYQVLVASSDSVLGGSRGDHWDTGKVASDETTGLIYDGSPLRSHERCYWKVLVWDKDDKPSGWSGPAFWSMGLLHPAEWKAEWIGYDRERRIQKYDAPFEGAKWIWFDNDPPLKAPKGHRLFVSEWTLPREEKIEKAELLIAGDDVYKFVINEQLVAEGVGWNYPKLVDVTKHLKSGASNHLRAEVENTSEGPAGLLAKVIVTTAAGKTLTHVSDGSWKGLGSAGANWHNRAMDLTTMAAARVLGNYGMSPWGTMQLEQLFLPPTPYLRTTFRAAKPVRQATLYATALGLCDLYLNGKRITEDRFNPGWTDYSKRVYYRAYDVTPMVAAGDNALGAILADGWYSGFIGWRHVRNHYGRNPRFRAQLHVDYADGTSAVVATGPAWKAHTGPIRQADFLMGETYDARLALDGWNKPGFDDSKWDKVDAGAELKPVVQHHPGPPVRAIGEFSPMKITEPKPGSYVLDLGQNLAGIVRLQVSGRAGQKITLRFAERLNPDGTIYTANLREARCVDTYICRGGGVEVWEPRFTFHGFQYIEINGLTHWPEYHTASAVALSSDTPVVGAFACSDPILNRLHKNIYWTQRSNFIDIPTDCPQRDERLGWTGDAQVYLRAATLNTDVQAFFSKWLVDLDDGQRADGQFPMVAPVKVAEADGGPAWADAGGICPWTIYAVYGDRRLLERHYAAMTRFIAFCQKRSTPELLPPAKYHCFGDWLCIKADTPKDVICTAYFAYSTKLTATAAEVLGKSEDAAKYRQLFERIKASFNRAYVSEEGRIKGDTQTGYVLALAFDLLDADRQKLAAQHLVENIEARGGHLSTGFIGTKDLMLAMSGSAGTTLPTASCTTTPSLRGASRSSTAPRASGSAGTAGRRRRDFKIRG